MTAATATDASEAKPTRLAILLSATGSHCVAISKAIRDGHLPNCEIALVVCNVPGAPAIEATRELGLNVITLEGRGVEQRDHEDAISALLRKFRIDQVCLADYKRVLSASFVREWKGRMLNLHSSLLPAFPGSQPQRQALEYGVRFTGCTVHFVEEHLEAGAIVVQRMIEVAQNDTLESLTEKLSIEEQIAYVDAIACVLSGDYELRDRHYVRRTELRRTELPSEAPPQA